MKSHLFITSLVGLAGFLATPAGRSGPSIKGLAGLRLAGKAAWSALIRRRPRFDDSLLHQVSDHMLKDMGLSRSELRHGVPPRARWR